jgi:hypothetical protein
MPRAVPPHHDPLAEALACTHYNLVSFRSHRLMNSLKTATTGLGKPKINIQGVDVGSRKFVYLDPNTIAAYLSSHSKSSSSP